MCESLGRATGRRAGGRSPVTGGGFWALPAHGALGLACRLAGSCLQSACWVSPAGWQGLACTRRAGSRLHGVLGLAFTRHAASIFTKIP
eukprot:355041-Chlamydomonas_euryale.AAC.5